MVQHNDSDVNFAHYRGQRMRRITAVTLRALDVEKSVGDYSQSNNVTAHRRAGCFGGKGLVQTVSFL